MSWSACQEEQCSSTLAYFYIPHGDLWCSSCNDSSVGCCNFPVDCGSIHLEPCHVLLCATSRAMPVTLRVLPTFWTKEKYVRTRASSVPGCSLVLCSDCLFGDGPYKLNLCSSVWVNTYTLCVSIWLRVVSSWCLQHLLIKSGQWAFLSSYHVFVWLLSWKNKSGIAVHSCYASTWEAEAGGLQIRD